LLSATSAPRGQLPYIVDDGETPFGVYSQTLRTLRAMCDPIERVPPHGAWLWRLRNTADN